MGWRKICALEWWDFDRRRFLPYNSCGASSGIVITITPKQNLPEGTTVNTAFFASAST